MPPPPPIVTEELRIKNVVVYVFVFIQDSHGVCIHRTEMNMLYQWCRKVMKSGGGQHL